MREIKFRAWDKKKGKMLGMKNVKIIFLNEKYVTLDNTFMLEDRNYSSVEIMQYTGLKDKNDKEIYEGDIIQIINKITKCIIIFEHGSFGRKYISKQRKLLNILEEGKSYLPQNINLWEVIGNIYENPEIIEEEK